MSDQAQNSGRSTTFDHKKSAAFQKFTEDAMRTMFNGFKSRHQGSGHDELLAKWESRLNSVEMLDDHMCHAMITDLSSLIADKDAKKKYEDEANKCVNQVFNNMQDQAIKDEDQWKYQMLQMFAIMTPLGAFSIAGQVFNYLDPLLDIFGPIFGKAGVIEGIAGIPTSDSLGPFGKLAEMMKVDEGVKAVLNIPILKDLLEIVDLVSTNENVQLLGAEVCPALTASELLITGVAGVMIANNATEALENHDRKSKIEDNKGKAVEDLKKLGNKIPFAPSTGGIKGDSAINRNNGSSSKPEEDSSQKLDEVKSGAEGSQGELRRKIKRNKDGNIEMDTVDRPPTSVRPSSRHISRMVDHDSVRVH